MKPQATLSAIALFVLLHSSSFLFANGICIVDAAEGLYFQLVSSRVEVSANGQIATVTATQAFRNNLGSDTLVKYAFPMSLTASATRLRWYNNGQWYEAEFSPTPQDTTLPGTGEPGNPSFADVIKSYLGNSPLYFDLGQSVQEDSILLVELTYVDLLPYAFNKVEFFLPNDYSTLQNAPLEYQEFFFTLHSQRTIDWIGMLSHSGAVISNDGNSATVAVALYEEPATKDYRLQYELNATELGLFSYSTFLPDSASQCDDHGRGFFTFIVEPDPSENTEVIDKVFTLIIDRSGSMTGEKIVQARDAAAFIVDNLNPGDRFNLISFNASINSFRPGHVPATLENLQAAQAYIDGLTATGSTNISGAFEEAIPQFQGNNTNLANIIIFFTDGQPTSGVTDTEGILEGISTQLATYEVEDLSIFTFGIGADVNKQLLNKMANQNLGLARFLENDELQEAISTFYLTIKNPVLLNTQMAFTPPVITETYPIQLPNLFKGQQLIVTGRYETPQPVSVTFSGKAFGMPVSYEYPMLLADTAAPAFQFLPRLWAKQKMEYLYTEYFNYPEDSPPALALEEEIIGISFCYGVISPFTSFADNSDDGGGGVVETDEFSFYPIDEKVVWLHTYPIPFHSSVIIQIPVQQDQFQEVALEFLSADGKTVRMIRIFLGAAGLQEVQWDGRDEQGREMPAGLYYCRLRLGEQVFIARMLKA